MVVGGSVVVDELEVDDSAGAVVVGGSVVEVVELVVPGEVLPGAELGGGVVVEVRGAGGGAVVAGGAVVIGGGGSGEGPRLGGGGGVAPGLAPPATTRTAPA